MVSFLRHLRPVLLLAIVLFFPARSLFAQNPSVACSIPASPGGQTESTPAVVSGIRHARLKFEVQSNGVQLSDLEAEWTDQSFPTAWIEVWRIDGGRRERVVSYVEQTGSGQELSTFNASIALRIPVDDERRARDIREYLDWVEATEGSDPRNADIVRRLRAQRAAAVTAMKSLYLQNMAGSYAVECEYRSTAPGTWQGTARAPTLYLRVRDDEKFFDQPGFRRQPQKR